MVYPLTIARFIAVTNTAPINTARDEEQTEHDNILALDARAATKRARKAALPALEEQELSVGNFAAAEVLAAEAVQVDADLRSIAGAERLARSRRDAKTVARARLETPPMSVEAEVIAAEAEALVASLAAKMSEMRAARREYTARFSQAEFAGGSPEASQYGAATVFALTPLARQLETLLRDVAP